MTATGGRGGGKENFAQGGFPVPQDKGQIAQVIVKAIT